MSKLKAILKSFIADDKTLVNELTEPPKKTITKPTWNNSNIEENQYHQIDLLYLPTDNGYKYLLVAVDVATKHIQARPLKKRNGPEVLKQIKSIYGKSKNSLHKPLFLHMDAGTEFSDTKKWAKNENIGFRVASPNRHSQQSIVEAMNKIIGKSILTLQLNEELTNDETNTEWVHFLPKIIKVLNEHATPSKFKKLKGNEPILCKKDECNIKFIDGDKVRVALDAPENIQGKKTDSKFRSGDIRWSRKSYEIEKVLILPNQPIRYVIKGFSNSFSPNQIKSFKQLNAVPIVKKYSVEKLLKRFKKNNRIYFTVKWVGYDKTTDELRTELIKDVPNLIHQKEQELKIA